MNSTSEKASLLRWEDDPICKMGKRPLRISRLRDGSRLPVDIDFESDDDTGLIKLERRSSYRKKFVGLWPLELAVLCVEHVQYNAMLLAMSLYWAFPLNYIKGFSFILWANIDAWDFYALHAIVTDSAGVVGQVYKGSRNTNLMSADIKLDYTWIARGWALAVGTCAMLVLALWVYFHRVRRYYQHRSAILLMLTSWFAVLLAVPALHSSVRVFQCRTESLNGTSRFVVDTMNAVDCNSATRIGSIVTTVILVIVPLFCALPVTMCFWIHSQLVSGCPKRHEAYLKMKEAEFGQGLNDSWLLGKWTLFAAFKRRAVYYHPLSFAVKFMLCIIAWLSHDQRLAWKTAQASACVAIFALWTLWSAAAWRGPYRLAALNVAHYISMVSLLLVSLLGALISADVDSPLLRGELLQVYLIVINSIAAGLLLCIWIYLVLKTVRARSGYSEGVWPALFNRAARKKKLDQTTSRYLLAMQRAQQCLRITKEAIPVLAPCHELARHIQIINAYCREAEHQDDQLHSSLWQLLDELTAVHAVLLRKSIFADTSKESVRYCAQELLKLLPAWQKQLQQREKDFILMRPVKRRILLKLYVMSLFLSKSSGTQANRRPRSSNPGPGSSEGKQRKKSGVRFADTLDVYSVSSGDVGDYLRTASQSTLGMLDDDDTGVHDRFLKAIDELLPEQRARGYSTVSTFSEGNLDMAQPALSNVLEEPEQAITSGGEVTADADHLTVRSAFQSEVEDTSV